MTITELLPWLNLALVPGLGVLFSINGRLSSIESTLKAYGSRLEAVDGIKS